jgi:maleylpyruvate isomerase
MDGAQRELNDQIDYATQRLLDDARIIPEAELRTPSHLPAWTRAHVLAHVARSADAMRNLLIGARSGQARPAYASAKAREADIERGAAMTAKDLMADLADSAMALRTIVKQLPDEAWQVRVRVLDSAPFPAAELLTRRLVEVELRHCDLGVGYSAADWPAAFATMELAEPMRSQRQDRLGYPPPSPGAKPRFPVRPPAPWRPGQRLPGSWLGTGDKSRTLPAPSAGGTCISTPQGDGASCDPILWMWARACAWQHARASRAGGPHWPGFQSGPAPHRMPGLPSSRGAYPLRPIQPPAGALCGTNRTL